MQGKWAIGIIALWIILTILSNMMEQSALLGQVDPKTGLTQVGTLQSIMTNPISVNPITSLNNLVHLGATVTQIAILYYPTLWQGSAIFVYLIFFLPIGIGFVYIFLTTVLPVIAQLASSVFKIFVP